MTRLIYLDHAATTPILPEAAAAIRAACDAWATLPPPMKRAQGPLGDGGGAAADRSRSRLGGARSSSPSGATEASRSPCAAPRLAAHRLVDLASGGAARRPRGPADRGARRRHDRPRRSRRGPGGGDAPAVAVQSVNNETGVIHPIEDIAARVAAAGGLLLVDCAQSAGKLPLPQADFISIAAHKFGGPPGIGALLAKDAATLEAVGGQEGGHRPGTAAVPMIMGFAAACEADHGWYEGAKRLRALLDRGIEEAGGEIIAGAAPRIATIAGYRMPGVPAASQMMQMDLAGIAVSAGSACSSGSLKASPVLAAMGVPEDEAREVIRVSFGPQTLADDIEALLVEWRRLFARRRAA